MIHFITLFYLEIAYPQEQATAVDSQVEIKCKYIQSPKWTLNGEYLPSNIIVKRYSLIIKAVKLINRGKYECKGYIPTGRYVISESLLYISGKNYSTILTQY